MINGIGNKIINNTPEKIPTYMECTEVVEEKHINCDSSIEEIEEYILHKEALIDRHQEELDDIAQNMQENVYESYLDYKDSKENLDEILNNKGFFGFFSKKYLAKLSEIQEQEKQILEKELLLNAIDDQILSIEDNTLANKNEVDALDITKDENNEFEYESEWQNKNLLESNEAIDTRISEVENMLMQDNARKEALQDERKKIVSEIKSHKDKIEEYEEEKKSYEKFVKFFSGKKTDSAIDEYTMAKEEYENLKKSHKENEENEIAEIQRDIKYANEILKAKKIEQYKNEYAIKKYEFNFETNLGEIQERDLKNFTENFNENSEKYKNVEEATGIPAELVAAIHWRECTGDFSKYLHNGELLGYTTTKTPKGLYFEDWTEAAIHAMKSHKPEMIEKDNIESWYEFAENYNGWGYRNMGLESPYIWSGTEKYVSGKFVGDGVYESSYKDDQLGVAVMLKELLS